MSEKTEIKGTILDLEGDDVITIELSQEEVNSILEGEDAGGFEEALSEAQNYAHSEGVTATLVVRIAPPPAEED